MHLARFPRIHLAHLPTPPQQLDLLTAELGGPYRRTPKFNKNGKVFLHTGGIAAMFGYTSAFYEGGCIAKLAA